jgi:chromosome segregation ATPase
MPQAPAGIDLDALAEIFACKQAPDRTIFRIEDLENQMKEMAAKMANLDNGQNDLTGRVVKLEKFEKEANTKFDDIYEQLKNMKAQIAQLLSMGGSSGEAPDMSAFFKQLADL